VDDAALLTLASIQHSVISDAQAIEHGLSAEMIRRRIRAGEWQRVLPRVLRRAGAPTSGRQAAMAACLWAGSDAVISHATAGVLWALDGIQTRRIAITLPAGVERRSPLVDVHWSQTLPVVDRTRLAGIPITSATRTLVDIAGLVHRDRLELAVEDAFRKRLSGPAQLRTRLDSLGGSGRAGTAQLRALLDERGERALSGSRREVDLERLLVRGGLPRPVRQFAITHGGRTIHVDLAYPDRRLAIEFDSLRWHTGRARLDIDAARRNLLRAAQWDLVTVTFTMLNDDPAGTFATVAHAYATVLPVHS
jgi:hypothetical protein